MMFRFKVTNMRNVSDGGGRGCTHTAQFMCCTRYITYTNTYRIKENHHLQLVFCIPAVPLKIEKKKNNKRRMRRINGSRVGGEECCLVGAVRKDAFDHPLVKYLFTQQDTET